MKDSLDRSIVKATHSLSSIVPDRCTDDVAGLEQFVRVFHSRFGPTGPIIYIGSLDQAIQDSVSAPRAEVNHQSSPNFGTFLSLHSDAH